MSFRARSDTPGKPYVYIYINASPAVVSSFTIPHHVDANGIHDDPVFLSTGKTSAYRWRWNGTTFVKQQLPIQYGRVEYVLMTTPAGAVYVYGVDDAGDFYLEEFDSGVPRDRRVRFTILHKGGLVWVADNRQPMPRPAGWS